VHRRKKLNSPVQKPPLRAWILLIILALIWGSSFILIKRGLVGLTPQMVGSLRIVAASLFLLPFAIHRLSRVSRSHWKYLASIGFLGSLIPSFLFAIAQTQLDSAVTGVLNALTPIFTVLVGLIVYKQRQKANIFVGISIGFIGAVILSLAGASGALSFNLFVFFVVAATLCYGLNLNIIKYHLGNLQALTVTSISLMLTGPVALIHLAVFTDFFPRVLAEPAVQLAAGYIALLGVMGTAIALIIFNKVVQITEPVFASSVTYIIPIVAVVWGVLDNETLQVMHFVGMATILVGVYITNRIRS
jgi:drug/metabolite transporter (DMT)-like permease